MRGRILSGLAVVALAGCTEAESPADVELAVPVYASNAASQAFSTHVSGAEEVPVHDTRAQGQATFRLSDDGTSLHYRLVVANIENVLQAHIHMAPAGVNGGIVVWLYPSAPPAVLIPGRSQGLLAEGTIEDADVINALAGQGVAGLLEQIRAGNTYVNVHTTKFPPGEIRGQLD